MKTKSILSLLLVSFVLSNEGFSLQEGSSQKIIEKKSEDISSCGLSGKSYLKILQEMDPYMLKDWGLFDEDPGYKNWDAYFQAYKEMIPDASNVISGKVDHQRIWSVSAPDMSLRKKKSVKLPRSQIKKILAARKLLTNISKLQPEGSKKARNALNASYKLLEFQSCVRKEKLIAMAKAKETEQNQFHIGFGLAVLHEKAKASSAHENEAVPNLLTPPADDPLATLALNTKNTDPLSDLDTAAPDALLVPSAQVKIQQPELVQSMASIGMRKAPSEVSVAVDCKNLAPAQERIATWKKDTAAALGSKKKLLGDMFGLIPFYKFYRHRLEFKKQTVLAEQSFQMEKLELGINNCNKQRSKELLQGIVGTAEQKPSMESSHSAVQ